MRLSLVALSASTALFALAWSEVGCGGDSGSTFGGPPPPPPPGSNVAPPPSLLPGKQEGPYPDLPAEPILDGDVPGNVKDLFAAAEFGAAGGPCLMEPEVGAMLPKNWLRPRFRFIQADTLAAGGPTGPAQDIYEIRVRAPNQIHELVVYTKNKSWTMPAEMWTSLREHSAGLEMTMSVRGAKLDGDKLKDGLEGSKGPLTIAPVEAPGAIVYWTSKALGGGGQYNPVLKGFRVGDESVRDVLRPEQLPSTDLGEVKCVGCHTSTPDGIYTVATTRPIASGGDPSQIGFGLVDGGAGAPPYLTTQARELLARVTQTEPAFSLAHWKDGDRVAVTMFGNSSGYQIAWTDLEAKSKTEGTAWGIFQRVGDPNFAAGAHVSRDGSKIVYISTTNTDTSGNIVRNGKLFTIPWNNRQGGNATELMGANAAGKKQFYPMFSPDDALVVFNRSVEGTSSYNDFQDEIYVINASGGTAERIAANDPPMCSGAKSPGIANAWPKFAPKVGESGGKKYYFVVFSSARSNGSAQFGARLHIAPIVIEGAKVTTYSALYLWNQPEEDNHSPAWDAFDIPEATVK